MDLNANKGPKLARPTIPIAALATVAVVCRFVARKRNKTRLGADDFMIVLGCVRHSFIINKYRTLILGY